MFTPKLSILSAMVIIMIVLSSMSLSEHGKVKSEAILLIGRLYESDIRTFDSCLQEYPKYFLDSSYALRKQKYGELAYQLKKIECLFVYFHPKMAYESFLMVPQFQKRDFGPPFPDNWLFIGPFGIDPDSVLAKAKPDNLVFEKKFIERSVNGFRKILQQSLYANDVLEMTDADVFDALRLQIIRMSTMGLANADFVITEAGMPALNGEFDSWSSIMNILVTQLPDDNLKNNITQKLNAAATVLGNEKDFNGFNRMAFLKDYLIPLSGYLNELQSSLKVESKIKFSPFYKDAASIYDKNAFNADYFSPGEESYYSAPKAILGKFLFFDPILSGNNRRACASCHKPELAFTDGNIKSLNFEKGDLPRNSPTVINASFQKSQFWDLRAGSLEDQLDSVILSSDELHSSFEDAIAKINASQEYKNLFNSAFPETKTTGIQRKHIKIAIASYERELTGLNSRFDKYIRGESNQMNESEINGFNLYMGKAKCGTCHYAPLFSGALPPYFDFTDHRAIGVPLKDSMKVFEIDIDTGASKVFKDPFLHFSFKIPTVRNVQLTAPYMHNGVFKTLEQVVDFYNDAAGMKFIKDMRPGMKGLPFFMILPEKLNLTEIEKGDLVAFMKTLTDISSTKNIPNRLPQITGKYTRFNKRKIGGEY